MPALPTFVKTWNFAKINQRIPYVSLNDTMATYLYELKSYLVTTMGASVVMSCDGTTGPASGADSTDRWLSKANCTTRGALITNANSWIVLTWAGVQLSLSYQGASDDIARIGFSQGSLYVPAGTATFTPTAADEILICSGISLILPTLSGDRVFSAVATTDRSVLRVVMYRANTLVREWHLELFNEAPGVPDGIAVGGNCATTWANVTGNGASLGQSSGTSGAVGSGGARHAGATINVNGGGAVASNFLPNNFEASPSLNGGAPVMPLFFSSLTAAHSGWLGTRYDAFIAWCSAVEGDAFDDLTTGTRCLVIGTFLQPWSPTDGLITT